MVELAPQDYRALVNQIASELAALVPAPATAKAAAPGRADGLAGMLESTLLSADASAAQIEQLCADAARCGFAAVCVNPAWVALAAQRLRATPVAVATVIGFPLGATLATVKLHEAAECLKLGADELDMVINLGALKSGHDAQVGVEIRALAELARSAGARLKAILEMGLLSEAEKERVVRLALEAGADYLKTSTGFGPSGATVADVARLRAAAGDRAGVKAAGGIRTRAQAEAMRQAGADRIGTSAAVAIVNEAGH